MLTVGLEDMEGVVYIDENDEPKVLVRKGMHVLKLSR